MTAKILSLENYRRTRFSPLSSSDTNRRPPVRDVKVQIRRLKSRTSTSAREELNKPYANEIRRGALSPDVYEDLLIRQLAKGVIVGWEGVKLSDVRALSEGEEDVEVPYNFENAYAVLKNLPEFRDEIFAVSVERDVYTKSADEDAKANLSIT